MKILIMTQYFYPENFRVNTLAKELVQRNHEVTVLTGYPQYPYGKIYDGYAFNKEYKKVWNGVKVERVKMKPRGKTPIGLFLNCLTYVTQANKWVKKCKEKFDFIYVFEVSPVTVGLPAITYKKKFGTPIFFNVQDLWPENVEEVLGIHNKVIIGVINKIVDKIYINSDKILCSSKSFVENIANRGVDRKKLIYWPQFCETPNLKNSIKPKCYDEKFFNIVFTGNIGDAQGLDLLVDTAIKMKEKNIKWFIVGDGRARQRLQKKVIDNGIQNIVIFTGKVSENEANIYVHFADCAYLSFANNKLFDMTIPAKLQTYMMCGTPIIGAVGGETADIIYESKCGLVSEKKPNDLSDKIIQFINIENKNNMRENAIKYANIHFDKLNLIEKLENLVLK